MQTVSDHRMLSPSWSICNTRPTPKAWGALQNRAGNMSKKRTRVVVSSALHRDGMPVNAQ